eukprot:678155-Pelagomonas_calceolata.AAC.1
MNVELASKARSINFQEVGRQRSFHPASAHHTTGVLQSFSLSCSSARALQESCNNRRFRPRGAIHHFGMSKHVP